MSTYDYFQRAFRRGAQPCVGTAGQLIQEDDRTCAAFWLTAHEGQISTVQYRCTTCVTLLAFCEHLSELAVGMPLEQAIDDHSGRLLALHPDVPKYKSNRAKLASDAFRSAVQQINQGATV
jgi:hypothetical protein